MRTCPPLEMLRRRQRIGPAGWQLPLAFETSIRVIAAPLVRPRPLNTTVEPPVAASTAFGVPSAPLRFWIVSGAAASDSGTSHRPAGLLMLTIQLLPLLARAHAAVSVSTSWKRTWAL